MNISVTKQELADKYQISSAKLRRLMNVVFFDELTSAGYNKESNLLSPKVIEKFVECYGHPVDHLNIKDYD